LAGWRINTGPRGGGSGPLFRQLAEANKLPPEQLQLGDATAVNGVVELVQGRIDALVMVSAADAPLVQYLLQTPGVRLFDFAQAEAYARRFPFLHPLLLPRGVVDLAADWPQQDVHLVASTASLVVRADLHPALMQLLVQTAHQVHGEAGWFAKSGEFPKPDSTALPLAPEAERFYRSGPPWLQRHLPFWLANFLDRMWIVLLPLLAAMVPLSRVLPPLVTLRLRSRVFRWYADLRAVERALDRPDADRSALRAELDRIDAQLEHVGVPLSYTHELYELRSHIVLVRKRLQPAQPAAS
ncbi:MAG: TAXI family TRAP transporter solute-binding subunit, partial [Rubrivivax sp.]